MSQHASQPTNLAGGLDRHNHRILARIYQHPLTHNLEQRDVTRLFNAIGLAETLKNGDIGLRIGDDSLKLVRSHGKDLGTDEVILLRQFLDRTGWSPTAPDIAGPEVSEHATAVELDMVIIIDHAGARIHTLGSSDEPRHLLHDTDRKALDSNREETYPADQRFFAGIAAIVSCAARIVVISHGTGQSNEAGHLISWLESHDKDVRANIVSEIVADLPHTTEPELLVLATQALTRAVSNTTPKGAS